MPLRAHLNGTIARPTHLLQGDNGTSKMRPAAPKGACRPLSVGVAIDMALLTELSPPEPIPLKVARNLGFRQKILNATAFVLVLDPVQCPGQKRCPKTLKCDL